MSASTDPAGRVLAYHARTKHHVHRFAPGPGYLDWDSQPDPFRTYAGAEVLELPLAADRVATRYSDLWCAGAVEPRPLERDSVAAFFELALGLTAWKELGDARWALRSDPSSGNLHPTEGYAVLPAAPGLPAGVHHYVSRDHLLEARCRLDPDSAAELERRLPAGGFLVGLSSIHWREAWKYGERAFRYCQHDTGHVIATVRVAAAALGWSAWLLDGFGDARVAAVLGLDRDDDCADLDELDREHPDVLLLVAPGGSARDAESLERSAGELAELTARGSWAGRPNALSPSHVDWDVIADVAEAARKLPSSRPFWEAPPAFELGGPACETPAATIIRQRRSAVALDGTTSIPRERFYALLEKLQPRRAEPPWDVLPWAPRLHLGIFVHRVDDLAPGLYLLERTADVHAAFEAMLGDEARWSRAPGCPEHLRLFLLGEGDYRRTAASVSCGQDIAGDGAFSLGMIADFEGTIAADPSSYRRLYWESGIIGQVLYLEAEAHGVRGTGIGCYFDDAFHEVCGIEGHRFQSLYHFTVGGPVDDTRLATLPPYAHLADRRRPTPS